MNKIDSKKIFGSLAPYYRNYSKKKTPYLSSIDQLILENLPDSPRQILDVGCGDGVRSYNLFIKTNALEFWMIDNSKEMCVLAKKFHKKEGVKVLQLDITEKNVAQRMPSNYFDTIWCLWNVLGHIAEYPKRICAMLNMKNALRKKGRLLIDISNRYNIAHYGWKKVIKNTLNDIIKPNVDNGNIEYKIKVAPNKEINSYCHFFSPWEIPKILKQLNLKLLKSICVDYRTGKLTNRWGGHIFYVIEKP